MHITFILNVIQYYSAYIIYYKVLNIFHISAHLIQQVFYIHMYDQIQLILIALVTTIIGKFNILLELGLGYHVPTIIGIFGYNVIYLIKCIQYYIQLVFVYKIIQTHYITYVKNRNFYPLIKSIFV